MVVDILLFISLLSTVNGSMMRLVWLFGLLVAFRLRSDRNCVLWMDRSCWRYCSFLRDPLGETLSTFHGHRCFKVCDMSLQNGHNTSICVDRESLASAGCHNESFPTVSAPLSATVELSSTCMARRSSLFFSRHLGHLLHLHTVYRSAVA